ncbi:hypothetical protein Efla_004936 [Eimeria flavescens]
MGLTSCVLLFAASAKVLCLLVVAAVARVVYSRCADVQHASIGSGCRQVDGRRGVPSHWQRWLGPSPNVECRTELITASRFAGVATIIQLQSLPRWCKVIEQFIVGSGVALAVGDSEQLLESAEVHAGNASLCRRRRRRQRLYGTAYDWVTAGSSGFASANLAKMAASAMRAVAALRWTSGIEMCCMGRLALDVGRCVCGYTFEQSRRAFERSMPGGIKTCHIMS